MANFQQKVFKLLVICLISLLPECLCQPQIQIPLENTAGQAGDHINMYVKAKKTKESDYLGFFYSPAGTFEEIWAENRQDEIIDPAKFSVEFIVYQDPTDGNAQIGEYNLTIIADTSLGLRYRANFLLDTGISTIGEVVVLESLQCPAEGQEKDEDQEIMVMCDTFYHGYKVPTLKWFNMNGEVPGITIDIDEENHHVSATVNITAQGEHNEMTFYCRLMFQTDVDETVPAPEYTTECTTFYYVDHGASNIVTYPDPDNFPSSIIEVYEGDIINCSANGRPEPEYVWYYDDGVPSPGQNLIIDYKFVRDTTVYARCEAINQIDGQERKAEKEIEFKAYEAIPTGPPASAGTAGWVIALSIIFSLIVVGVIGGAAVYYVTKVRNKDGKPPPSKPAIQPPAGNPAYDNRSFQSAGGPPRQQNAPMSGSGNVHNLPFSGYGGQTQQGYPGKGSPGYADLGVRHLTGSHPSLSGSLNQSSDSQSDPHTYSSISKNPKGGSAV